MQEQGSSLATWVSDLSMPLVLLAFNYYLYILPPSLPPSPSSPLPCKWGWSPSSISSTAVSISSNNSQSRFTTSQEEGMCVCEECEGWRGKECEGGKLGAEECGELRVTSVMFVIFYRGSQALRFLHKNQIKVTMYALCLVAVTI